MRASLLKLSRSFCRQSFLHWRPHDNILRYRPCQSWLHRGLGRRRRILSSVVVLAINRILVVVFIVPVIILLAFAVHCLLQARDERGLPPFDVEPARLQANLEYLDGEFGELLLRARLGALAAGRRRGRLVGGPPSLRRRHLLLGRVVDK